MARKLLIFGMLLLLPLLAACGAQPASDSGADSSADSGSESLVYCRTSTRV